MRPIASGRRVGTGPGCPRGIAGDVTDRRIDTGGRTVGRQLPWEIADLVGGCVVGHGKGPRKQGGEAPRRGVVDEAGADRRAFERDPYTEVDGEAYAKIMR